MGERELTKMLSEHLLTLSLSLSLVFVDIYIYIQNIYLCVCWSMLVMHTSRLSEDRGTHYPLT